MARTFKNINKAVRQIDNAVATGRKRALNKAARATRTFINKTIRQEISLKSKDVNKRLIVNRTQTGLKKRFSFQSSVGVATRAVHPLRIFNPKKKRVSIGKGKPFGNFRQGATVRLTKKRQFIPNAFIMNVRGNEIVAARKGTKRKPTKELTTTLFVDTVNKNLKKFTTFMATEYRRIVNREIEFALGKRLTKNSGDK